MTVTSDDLDDHDVIFNVRQPPQFNVYFFYRKYGQKYGHLSLPKLNISLSEALTDTDNVDTSLDVPNTTVTG